MCAYIAYAACVLTQGAGLPDDDDEDEGESGGPLERPDSAETLIYSFDGEDAEEQKEAAEDEKQGQ